MKKLILVLVLAIIFGGGCRKYPDGPIQIGRIVPKMLQGRWKMTNYIINGIDSTSEYNARYNNKECTFDIPYLKYEYHGPELYINISWGDTSGQHFFDERPFYGFKHNKGFMDVSALKQIDTYGKEIIWGRLWEILKLTKNEFWFQIDDITIEGEKSTTPSKEIHLTLINH